MKVEALMRFLEKVITTLLTFVFLYTLIMIGVYHFIYPYPVGALDEMERRDGALTYRLIDSRYLDKDTIIYFTRSKNGAGDRAHVGTYDSQLPTLIANFKCESTSSQYLPMDSYGILKTNNRDNYYILYGGTRDENTVAVKIVFYGEDDNNTSIRIPVDDFFFYTVGINPELLNQESRIYGLNYEDGITFEYGGDALIEPGYISKYKES